MTVRHACDDNSRWGGSWRRPCTSRVPAGALGGAGVGGAKSWNLAVLLQRHAARQARKLGRGRVSEGGGLVVVWQKERACGSKTSSNVSNFAPTLTTKKLRVPPPLASWTGDCGFVSKSVPPLARPRDSVSRPRLAPLSWTGRFGSRSVLLFTAPVLQSAPATCFDPFKLENCFLPRESSVLRPSAASDRGSRRKRRSTRKGDFQGRQKKCRRASESF